MALDQVSLAVLDEQFMKFSREVLKEKLKTLSTLLRDSPKQEPGSYKVVEGTKLPELRKNEVLLLYTLLYYFPEEPSSWQIHLDLKDRYEKVYPVEISILSLGKSFALGFWKSNDFCNTRDFFGNILNRYRMKKIFNSIFWKYGSSFKVERYTGYCRGYSESGRWSSSKSKSINPKKFETELQNERRQLIQCLRKTLLLKRVISCLEK